MQETVQSICNFFSSHGIPDWLVVFIISLLPVLECRGGLIAAILIFDMPLPEAIGITLLGNAIPIPFILLLINKIFDLLKKVPGINKIVFWLEAKTLKKKDKIDKYGPWGLLLFVGIPLPGTGGWTGSLLASLLHIDFKKSFPIICLGVVIAGVIITILSYTVKGFLF